MACHSDLILSLSLKSFLIQNWSHVGNLVSDRNGHNVIYVDDVLIVAGGSGRYYTESCKIIFGEFECFEQNLSLYDCYAYPELFAVPENFCKSKH